MNLKFTGIGIMISLSSLAMSQGLVRGQRLEMPPELKELFNKAKSIRFSGTRVVTVVRAGQVQTHNEYVTKDGQNLRIEFAPGSPYAGQIIVESSDDRKHYFPDKNEIHEYPSFGKKQFEGFRGGFRSQKGGKPTFESSPGGIIAGLHCTKYQFSDGSKNPIAQIFVEPKSGLTLKRVLFDPTGNIAGSYEFVTVNLDPKIQSGAFKIVRNGAKVVRPIDELRKQGGLLGMPALSLPKASGYRLENVSVRDVNGAKVIIQSYGKEDSRVTLFMTKSSLKSSDLRKYNRGELVSFVKTLNGVTLVLMGDQPEERLRSLSNLLSE